MCSEQTGTSFTFAASRVLTLTRSVLKKGKSPAECLRNPAELPMQCQHLMSSYADCKKGMVRVRPLAMPSDLRYSLTPARHAQTVQGQPPQ